MHASTEAILLPTRRPIATLVVRLCACSALLFSGCATERNSRTARTAPSMAAQTRLESSDATNSARDPAVALTSTATQGPSQARPPSAVDDRPVQKPETRQEDLNVPVPSPPLIPPPSGEYPIDLSTALRLAEAENPTIAAARARIIEALALQTGRAGTPLALDQSRHKLSPPYRKPPAIGRQDPQPHRPITLLRRRCGRHRCRHGRDTYGQYHRDPDGGLVRTSGGPSARDRVELHRPGNR